MDKVIVLITRGKHDSVDYAQVVLFETIGAAQTFCKEKCTGRKKYWTDAVIVRNGEEVELMQPDWED